MLLKAFIVVGFGCRVSHPSEPHAAAGWRSTRCQQGPGGWMPRSVPKQER